MIGHESCLMCPLQGVAGVDGPQGPKGNMVQTQLPHYCSHQHVTISAFSAADLQTLG